MTTKTDHTNIEERFWGKVEARGEEACWEWTGSINNYGYGAFVFEGGLRGAHRVSYTLARGVIPRGMHVLHRCDNPPCVNPAHLFLGTHRQNIDDKVAKGRQARGETAGRAKGRTALTEDDVRFLREAVRSGNNNLRWLAAEIGICRLTIYDAVRGRTWKHVGGSVVSLRKYSKPERHIS